MTPPTPPEPRPEHLAAYADGELSPAARAAVERWLAAHPEAAADLHDQYEYGPGNWELWFRADPPQPTEPRWQRVRQAIAAEVARANRRPWRVGRWVAGGVAVAATAAAAVVAWVALTTPDAEPAPSGNATAVAPHEPDDPLAGLAVLPVAGTADVDIARVSGPDAEFVVGAAPFDGPLALAGEEDVHLTAADEHPAWPSGGPRMVLAPGAGDAPMIFAPRPR
jgi:anti-sigma factor RsiW